MWDWMKEVGKDALHGLNMLLTEWMRDFFAWFPTTEFGEDALTFFNGLPMVVQGLIKLWLIAFLVGFLFAVLRLIAESLFRKILVGCTYIIFSPYFLFKYYRKKKLLSENAPDSLTSLTQ